MNGVERSRVAAAGLGSTAAPSAGSPRTAERYEGAWIEIDIRQVGDLFGTASDANASDLLKPILDAYGLQTLFLANHSPDIGLEVVEADSDIEAAVYDYLDNVDDDVEAAIRYVASQHRAAVVVLLDGYEAAYAIVTREEDE